MVEFSYIWSVGRCGANDITTFVSLPQTDGDVGGGRENLHRAFPIVIIIVIIVYRHRCYEELYQWKNHHIINMEHWWHKPMEMWVAGGREGEPSIRLFLSSS